MVTTVTTPVRLSPHGKIYFLQATLVRVDPRYFRPTEVDTLLGDASKAKEKLGWEPEISFEEMVDEMVLEDLKLAQRDYMIKKAGFRAFDYNE